MMVFASLRSWLYMASIQIKNFLVSTEKGGLSFYNTTGVIVLMMDAKFKREWGE